MENANAGADGGAASGAWTNEESPRKAQQDALGDAAPCVVVPPKLSHRRSYWEAVLAGVRSSPCTHFKRSDQEMLLKTCSIEGWTVSSGAAKARKNNPGKYRELLARETPFAKKIQMDLGRTFTVFQRTETRNNSPVSFLVGRTETHLTLQGERANASSDPQQLRENNKTHTTGLPGGGRATSSSEPSNPNLSANNHHKAQEGDGGDPFSMYQTKLKNILHAVSLYDEEVGYCQGINFIAALLLVHSSNTFEEEGVFWLLVSILRRFNLAGLFMEDRPFLADFLSYFGDLLEERLPRLNHHFMASGFPIAVHSVEWFTTLFVCNLNIFSATCILDLFISGMCDVLPRAGIALLRILEDRLLAANGESLMMRFKDFVGEVDSSVLMRATLIEPPPMRGKDKLRLLTAMYSSETSRRMSVSMPVRIHRSRSMSKDYAGDETAIKALIPRTDAAGTGGYVRYVIECHDSIGSWMVCKRFRSFVNLHEQLAKQHPYTTLPMLPEKRLFGNKDARFVEERRVALESYFVKLLSVRDLKGSTTIVHYLSRSDPRRNPSQSNDGSSDFQTVEMFWRMACKHRWSEEAIADVLGWTQSSWFNPAELQTVPLPLVGNGPNMFASPTAPLGSDADSKSAKGRVDARSRKSRRNSFWSRMGGAALFQSVKETFKETLFPGGEQSEAPSKSGSGTARKLAGSRSRRRRKRGNTLNGVRDSGGGAEVASDGIIRRYVSDSWAVPVKRSGSSSARATPDPEIATISEEVKHEPSPPSHRQGRWYSGHQESSPGSSSKRRFMTPSEKFVPIADGNGEAGDEGAADTTNVSPYHIPVFSDKHFV